MSCDTIIAEIKNGEIFSGKQALLPLYLKNFGNLEHWLEGRAIDSHRTNSRLLKKALRLSHADDV
jgi:hypothetical protein